MFVITADQIDSTHTPDLVESTIAAIADLLGEAIALAPERTAGDEFQVLCTTAGATVDAALLLHRSERWSVGIAYGEVELPLPTSIRESRGPAFVGARFAVERAKRRPARMAVAAPDDPDGGAAVEALLDLLIATRSRRSAEGWELYDLLSEGMNQSDAAERLGITPQAVSRRAVVADLKTETAARAAIALVLARLAGSGS